MARLVSIITHGIPPPLVLDTFAITAVLFVSALSAFSGAGVIAPLRCTGFALPGISLVFLVRGFLWRNARWPVKQLPIQRVVMTIDGASGAVALASVGRPMTTGGGP